MLSSFSGNSIPFGMQADHYHFALSTSLRPAESESRYFPSAEKSIPGGGNCATMAYDGKHGCEVSSRGEIDCGCQGHCCGFDWRECVLAWKIFA